MKVRMWKTQMFLPLTALAFAFLLLAQPAQAEVRSLFARSFGAFVPTETNEFVPEKDRTREERSEIMTVGGSVKHRKASLIYDTVQISGLPARPPQGEDVEFDYIGVGANWGWTVERTSEDFRLGLDVSLETGFGELSAGGTSLDIDFGFELGSAFRGEFALAKMEKSELGLLALIGFNYGQWSMSSNGGDFDYLTASVPIMIGGYGMMDLGSELNVSGHAGFVVDPGYRRVEQGNTYFLLKPDRPPVNILVGGTIISKRKFVVNLGVTLIDDLTLRLGFGFNFK